MGANLIILFYVPPVLFFERNFFKTLAAMLWIEGSTNMFKMTFFVPVYGLAINQGTGWW